MNISSSLMVQTFIASQPLVPTNMKKPNNIFLKYALLVFFSISSAASVNGHKHFLSCFVQNSEHPIAVPRIISTPKRPSYSSLLEFDAQKLRFTLPKTPKPVAIITPENESHIQTAIYCSKRHGLQMRILSGDHDFEGSSLVSDVPFFVLNMFNFRSISIDAETQTAWLGAAATLGETDDSINQINSSLAFPAGYWPTVAIGGHISGGGYGPLVRKYGLAANNVVDARIIDANGRILDRKSMGEDLFGAIRGGTGASLGVILAYKIKLVEISKKVTAFSVKRTLEQNVTKLVHKWQFVAPKLPADLIISIAITNIHSNQTGNMVQRLGRVRDDSAESSPERKAPVRNRSDPTRRRETHRELAPTRSTRTESSPSRRETAESLPSLRVNPEQTKKPTESGTIVKGRIEASNPRPISFSWVGVDDKGCQNKHK